MRGGGACVCEVETTFFFCCEEQRERGRAGCAGRRVRQRERRAKGAEGAGCRAQRSQMGCGRAAGGVGWVVAGRGPPGRRRTSCSSLQPRQAQLQGQAQLEAELHARERVMQGGAQIQQQMQHHLEAMSLPAGGGSQVLQQAHRTEAHRTQDRAGTQEAGASATEGPVFDVGASGSSDQPGPAAPAKGVP